MLILHEKLLISASKLSMFSLVIVKSRVTLLTWCRSNFISFLGGDKSTYDRLYAFRENYLPEHYNLQCISSLIGGKIGWWGGIGGEEAD